MKRWFFCLLLLSGWVQAETLVIGKRHAPLSWDPIDGYNLLWGSIASNIFDGLVLRTETFSLAPGLAQDWQILEDGLHFRFQLRQGVVFHNGEPFNAAAVKFTFDRLLAEPKGLQRALYDSICQVDIIDDYTVDFWLNRYDPSFLVKLSGYGGMIVPPNYIKKYGEKYFDRNPVGTGPFKFDKAKEGEFLQLVANPHYFAGIAKVDSLLFRFIADDEQRVKEFLEGRLDILPDLPFAAIPRVKNAAEREVVSVPGLTVNMLEFNLDKKIVQDVRVRQALNMAIDKQVLINMLLNGYGRKVAGLQTAMMFGYDPQLAAYPYDPVYAKELLRQAGVKPGDTITINYVLNNYSWYEITRAISVFLKALDLNVRIEPIVRASRTHIDAVSQNKDELFQFGWNGWTLDFGDSAYLLFHSEQPWNPLINSRQVDLLLDQQRNLADQSQRQHILQQVAKIIHQQAYYIPLFNADAVYGVSKKVKNFVPASDKRIRYLETDIQR